MCIDVIHVNTEETRWKVVVEGSTMDAILFFLTLKATFAIHFYSNYINIHKGLDRYVLSCSARAQTVRSVPQSEQLITL